MTYNQTSQAQERAGTSSEGHATRGLHKTVNAYRDDGWHSVWKRIERADTEVARPARKPKTLLHQPLDYVEDRVF